MSHTRRDVISLVLAAAGGLLVTPARLEANTNLNELEQNATKALNQLMAGNARAAAFNKTAKRVLIFPRITKAGFLLGGAYGEGTLRQGGRTVAYYESASGSFGLQIGVQWFGYVLFLMTDEALHYLDKSDGWELGVGPSIVIEDQGAATKQSTTTLTQDVHAFIFNQEGLFAGAGLEGTKITKLPARPSS